MPLKKTYSLLSLLMITLSAMASPANLRADNTEIDDSLGELESLYKGVLPWVARLYDPKSGGFYESIGLREGKEPRDFGPDIQATHFAFSLIRSSDLLASMPPEVKGKLILYFQSRQNPETGYFSDPDYPDMLDNQRIMARALSFSVASLRSLGAAPLYPLPGKPRASANAPTRIELAASKTGQIVKTNQGPEETAPTASSSNRIPPASTNKDNAESNPDLEDKESASDNVYIVPNSKTLSIEIQANTPPHLASTEAFHQWLDERPWHFAWTAMDNIQSQQTLINSLPEPYRTTIIDKAIAYISERQEANTGLIGGGTPEVRLSGAFKLVLFFRAMKRPIPHTEEIQKTVIEWLESEPETEKIYFVRNTIDMLDILVEETGQNLTNEQMVAVINFATRELKRYLQSDGGFSRFTYGFYISPNDLYLSDADRIPAQAGPQGQLNGTTMAIRTRAALYTLAGRKTPSLRMYDFWDVALADGEHEPSQVEK
ncbi:hypothetical protein [Cerasicoccus arenae]|uniref:Uncharacterized protein n=1 Tax=Cerasicoccus arenae TaxID=424488 RepID=A0A8J3DEY8_9BACT|nr:hypothetical protein [Cerasicoccus arenae]MBK1859284.1 hypothetical protein [Cerasicoccus arenae]GHC13320.1 hypothetical protein GCM10007047_33310 [Cerasicoccus arenae]